MIVRNDFGESAAALTTSKGKAPRVDKGNTARVAAICNPAMSSATPIAKARPQTSRPLDGELVSPRAAVTVAIAYANMNNPKINVAWTKWVSRAPTTRPIEIAFVRFGYRRNCRVVYISHGRYP